MMRLPALAAWLLAVHAAINARLLRHPPAAAPRNRDDVERAETDASSPPPEVSVLIPARNEAARIGPCISALLQSRGVDFEVVVLDDCSTDDTAGTVRTAAAGDPRVRVVDGAPLPSGWLGKAHACTQLSRTARGHVLAFVDADVIVTPDGLARSVAMLADGPLDMVCPYPRQIVDGPATRLVQPLLQWSWLTFLPLRVAERSPKSSLVAANGQLLVCRACDYARAGGHAAVKNAVLEDLELARAFKRAGLRAGVVAGHDIATCAMYRTWDDVRAGYGKSLWAAFGSPAGAAGVLGVLLWLYVAPPAGAALALARGDHDRARWGLAAIIGGILGRVVAARHTGGIPVDGVWHPLSILALAALTLGSFRDRGSGDLAWRGRPLPADTR